MESEFGLELDSLDNLNIKYPMITSTRAGARKPHIKPPSLAPTPRFLAPAFNNGARRQALSGTARLESRIGSAPLSLPLEVNLRLLEPPSTRKNAVRRNELPKLVEVEGPLGKYTLLDLFESPLIAAGKLIHPIPPYMTIKQNQDTRKTTLHIPSQTERKHREMWGRRSYQH